jgi:hypothetical protein
VRRLEKSRPRQPPTSRVSRPGLWYENLWDDYPASPEKYVKPMVKPYCELSFSEIGRSTC